MTFLEEWPLERLEALQRAAKTRGRAFFAHPQAMIYLRNLIARKHNQ